MPDYKIKENLDGSYSVRQEPSINTAESAVGAFFLLYLIGLIIKVLVVWVYKHRIVLVINILYSSLVLVPIFILIKIYPNLSKSWFSLIFLLALFGGWWLVGIRQTLKEIKGCGGIVMGFFIYIICFLLAWYIIAGLIFQLVFHINLRNYSVSVY